jgi:hypothetical protein
MGVESYKHQFAKATLAGWFREICEENWNANVSHNLDHVALYPASWRVNRGRPYWGVWTEYPICLDKNNRIVGDQAWDETNWDQSHLDCECNTKCDCPKYKPGSLLDVRPPSYEEVIAIGLLPIAIFDVAIQHKGTVVYGFEVVHKNDVSKTKLEYLKRIFVEVYKIDADWILSRVARPKELVCQRIV